MQTVDALKGHSMDVHTFVFNNMSSQKINSIRQTMFVWVYVQYLHGISAQQLLSFHPPTFPNFHLPPTPYSSSDSLSSASFLYKKYCTKTQASKISVPKLPSNHEKLTAIYLP